MLLVFHALPIPRIVQYPLDLLSGPRGKGSATFAVVDGTYFYSCRYDSTKSLDSKI